MMNIEQLIKEKKREQFYNYYLSLGYEHKTAAALALFTYGRRRYSDFSMEDLYNALSEGKKYLPAEELEAEMLLRRKSMEGMTGVFSPETGSPQVPAPSYAPAEQPRPAAPAEAKGHGIIPRLLSFMGKQSAETEERSRAVPDSYRESRESIKKCRAIPERYREYAEASVKRFANSEVLYSGILPEAAAFSHQEALDKFEAALGFATDEYERIEEKDARTAAAEPTSTFRMTTNTASAGVILNQLRNGRRIDRSMVRIEEMLNYFRYDSEIPVDEMFNISCEIMDSDDSRKYLYINVQGREEVKDRQNIIILLDVSGSMSGNAEQTQAVVAAIVSKLGNGDKLSLVTYSSEDHVELEAFSVNGPEDRIRVLEKLLSIRIFGGTYGSRGIEKAYEIGKQNYIPGGNNQVILITDGDLNFGITDKGGLEELIEKKKKDNLFLSVIGTGLLNYKDDKLEVLSKHGNGVYRTVNNLSDVRKSIDEEYASLVNIIAKDVKAQVEFNPEVVENYRLLGFENRTLAREDFTNDKVISEPFGSGGYGVALYELKMNTGTAPAGSGLKYSRLVTTGSSETGTVKVRYKEPLEDTSHELEKVIETADESFTDNLRLAFIVYVCSEKLRGSDRISDKEITLAKRLYAELGSSVREKNASDLYKLAGILEKSEKELGIGIPDEPFPW